MGPVAAEGTSGTMGDRGTHGWRPKEGLSAPWAHGPHDWAHGPTGAWRPMGPMGPMAPIYFRGHAPIPLWNPCLSDSDCHGFKEEFDLRYK